MSVATVFATWFGAETVLSVSATFAKDGLGGIVADPARLFVLPFLRGALLPRAFYRMDSLTIGDFYRKRYSKSVEVMTSVRRSRLRTWAGPRPISPRSAWCFRAVGGLDRPEYRHLHRRRDRRGLHHLGRNVVGGADRSLPVRGHPDRPQGGRVLVGDMAGGASKVISAASEAGKFEFWPKRGPRNGSPRSPLPGRRLSRWLDSAADVFQASLRRRR